MSQTVELLDLSKMVGQHVGLQGVDRKAEGFENKAEEGSFLGKIQKFVDLASKKAKLVHISAGSPSAYSFSVREINRPFSEKEKEDNDLLSLQEEFKLLDEILRNATFEELCRYKTEICIKSEEMRRLSKSKSRKTEEGSESLDHSEDGKRGEDKLSKDEILRRKAVFKSLISLINSRINSRFYQEYAPDIESKVIMPEFDQAAVDSLEGLAIFIKLSNQVYQERKEYRERIKALLQLAVAGNGNKEEESSARQGVSVTDETKNEQSENKPVSKSDQGNEENAVEAIGRLYQDLTYARFISFRLRELYRLNKSKFESLLNPGFSQAELERIYKMERRLRDYPAKDVLNLANFFQLVLAISFALKVALVHVQQFLRRHNDSSPKVVELSPQYGESLEASGLVYTFGDGLIRYVIAAEEKLRQEQEKSQNVGKPQFNVPFAQESSNVNPGAGNAVVTNRTNQYIDGSLNHKQGVEAVSNINTEKQELLGKYDFEDTISFFREVASGSGNRNLRFVDSHGNSFILDLREADFSEISTDGKYLADWFGDYKKNPNATILTRIVFLKDDGKNFEVPVLVAHAGTNYPFNDLRDGKTSREIYLFNIDNSKSLRLKQIEPYRLFIDYNEFYSRIVSGVKLNEYLSDLGRTLTEDKMAFSPPPELAKAIGEQEKIRNLVVLITCTEEAVKGNGKSWDGVSLSLFTVVE